MPNLVVPEHVPDVVELHRVFQGPPEQIHRGQIDDLGDGQFADNPALKKAGDALGFAWDESGAINDFRATPDDEDRAATHDRKVRERVDAFERNWCQRIDGARAEVRRELAATEAELEVKAGLKPNPIMFDAITAAFYNMKPGDRVEKLNELIQQREHSALAILMEAPLMLTGLTAEQRDSIKTRVLMNVDPQGLKLRDALAKAADKIEAASLAALPMLNQLRAGTAPGAWRERAKQAAAHNLAANAH